MDDSEILVAGLLVAEGVAVVEPDEGVPEPEPEPEPDPEDPEVVAALDTVGEEEVLITPPGLILGDVVEEGEEREGGEEEGEGEGAGEDEREEDKMIRPPGLMLTDDDDDDPSAIVVVVAAAPAPPSATTSNLDDKLRQALCVIAIALEATEGSSGGIALVIK